MKAHSPRRDAAALFSMALIAMLAIGTLVLSHAGARAAFAQGTGTQGCWTSLPVPGSGDVAIRSIAGSSSKDVWAVGTQGNGTIVSPIASHWDGSKWTEAALSSPGTPSARLYGISVISPTDAWAVGSAGDNTLTRPQNTLILHWNGSTWTPVDSPNPTENINVLLTVAAVSSTNVWAAGYYEPSVNFPGDKQALLMHYNGQFWSQFDIQDLPPLAPGAGYSSIESISVISRDDVWAAGTGPQGFAPLALHWDGSAWHSVPTPQISGLFHSITATGHNDVWAVGESYRSVYQSSVDTLSMHWDGATWKIVDSRGPNEEPTGAAHSLQAVTALASNDVWAAGYHSNPLLAEQRVIKHWSGQGWTSLDNPTNENTPSSNMKAAVTIGGDLWIGGTYNLTNGSGLVLHRATGLCGPASPTPAVTPLATPVLNPPVPLPGTGSRTFAETGKTVSGVFLDYWNSHGGLAQQGYPISNLMGEVSDLNGKMYTVQYFERAVFEYHPENQPPYNVLLSQLGTFEYARVYGKAGATGQKPNNGPGSIFFPQTGHRVGGKFLEYWQYHGGLPQQGYPLTEEFTEVSPLNGLTYTVQYFERAVFEYHPENVGTPYEILLSQLGRFQYTRKYTGSGLVAAFTVRAPIVVGQKLYWIDVREHAVPQPHKSIYSLDLTSNKESLLTNTPDDIYALAGDGDRLLWVQTGEIISRDPVYGSTGIVVDANTQRNIGDGTGIAVYGDTLYYTYKTYDQSGGIRQGPLYAHNLRNQQDTLVAERGDMPVVSDGILLWQSQEPGPQGGYSALHMRNLRDTSQSDRVIAAQNTFSGYSASGDHIVWSDWGNPATPDVYVYTISTAEISRIPAHAAVNPIIKGDKVVWTEWLSRSVPGSVGSSIHAYDLSTGKDSVVVDNSTTFVQAWAITNDGRVVYTDQDDPVNGGLRKLYIK